MDSHESRSVIHSLGGADAVRKLKKAMKRVFGTEEDALGNAISLLGSLQACKDAALTGDEDVRLLAVSRLGDFQEEAIEALELALFDDSHRVRAMAAGMLAATRNKVIVPILEQHQNDNHEDVRGAVNFTLNWLETYGTGQETSEEEPVSTMGTATSLIDILEPMPVRTSNDVYVRCSYTASADMLEFRVTVSNNSIDPIQDVTVTLLSFPPDSLELTSNRINRIDEITSQGSDDSTVYIFRKTGENIEGEVITSLIFTDLLGERVSAKSGNCLIRSFFDQIETLDIDAAEFRHVKKQMHQWSREHAIAMDPQLLTGLLYDLAEKNNLSLFSEDSSQREGMFLGTIATGGKGSIKGSRIVVLFTVIGKIDDDLARIRVDVYSDDPEILHSAASQIYDDIKEIVTD